MRQVYCAFDFGFGSIKAVVGEVYQGQLVVFGSQKVKNSHSFLDQGQIINKKIMIANIQKTLCQLEAKLNLKINETALLLPPLGLQVFQVSGSAQNFATQEPLTPALFQSAKNASCKGIDEVNFKIIAYNIDQILVDQSKVDSSELFTLYGSNLEIQAHLYTIPTPFYRLYQELLTATALTPIFITPSSLAIAGEIALSSQQKTLVVDFGHYSTTVEKKFFKSLIIEQGGKHINHDLKTVLQLDSYQKAEELKHFFGKLGSIDQRIVFTGKEGDDFSVKYLNDIIKARLDKIFAKIQKFINNHLLAVNQKKKIDILITGGGAKLGNLGPYMADYFQQKIRFYQPNVIGARGPEYTALLGLIYLVNQKNKYNIEEAQKKKALDISNWIKEPDKLGKWHHFKKKFLNPKLRKDNDYGKPNSED